MRMRVLTLLAVLVLVAGCSSKPKESANVTMDAGLSTTEAAPESTVIDNTSGMGNGPVAGTQQDLVVNVGDRIFFDYDQYDLKPEARATVERQVQWLKQYANLRVTVEGHCDERGTREYNLALGERRATSVRNYMIALGLDASRIQTISYGKERPAVIGSDESSWAQNRRGVTSVE